MVALATKLRRSLLGTVGVVDDSAAFLLFLRGFAVVGSSDCSIDALVDIVVVDGLYSVVWHL